VKPNGLSELVVDCPSHAVLEPIVEVYVSLGTGFRLHAGALHTRGLEGFERLRFEVPGQQVELRTLEAQFERFNLALLKLAVFVASIKEGESLAKGECSLERFDDSGAGSRFLWTGGPL
jgi:hypothetical protein